MYRTVRNGLAIAGMAGGMLFLGQAVASASETGVDGSNNAAAGDSAQYNAEASNTNDSANTGGDGGEGGDGGNADTEVEQESSASNNVSNNAETGDINAVGGTSYVIVVAGNGNSVEAESEDEGNVDASQTVHNEVNVASHGGDAHVSDSNNASAGSGARYNAEASNSNTSENTGGDGGEDGNGGDADTDVDQDSTASNNVDNNAETGDINAVGGSSFVDVIAGNGNTLEAEAEDEGDVDAEQDITNEVDVESRGGNAHVGDSNNASAGDGAWYNAIARNENDSENTGGDGGEDGDGGDADTDVDQDSSSSNNVSNNAETGDINAVGGDSVVTVIVGNDNTLTCTSEEGDVDCEQHITNIVNILSVAGGAGVTCSNNASAGGHAWVCNKTDEGKDDDKKAAEKPAAAAPAAHVAAPAAHVAAPVVHAAAINKSAQPSKGQLAFTGSDVSAPLTLGLLALVAGGALSLAGRRRQTTTV